LPVTAQGEPTGGLSLVEAVSSDRFGFAQIDLTATLQVPGTTMLARFFFLDTPACTSGLGMSSSNGLLWQVQ